jgi:hypothetical protein
LAATENTVDRHIGITQKNKITPKGKRGDPLCPFLFSRFDAIEDLFLQEKKMGTQGKKNKIDNSAAKSRDVMGKMDGTTLSFRKAACA